MLSIGKRAAGLGAVVTALAIAGPVSIAGASTAPAATPAPVVSPYVSGAFQAGLAAAVGGWNAGADAAVGGWNAGLAALGSPFQFSVHTGGPLGLHLAGIGLLSTP
jgi:hypothetical protein